MTRRDITNFCPTFLDVFEDYPFDDIVDDSALPSVIALASCALGKPTLSSLAVLGGISISGTILKVEELASVLQVCLDAGGRRY